MLLEVELPGRSETDIIKHIKFYRTFIKELFHFSYPVYPFLATQRISYETNFGTETMVRSRVLTPVIGDLLK